MPEPAGCNAARKIPQKRLGKAFPEEPFAGLSHGVNWRTNNGSASQFQVDNQNELTNYSGTTCGYDSNGNLTSAGVNKLYVYDDENRLVQWFSYQTSCTSPQNGDLRTDFIYDGLGRLRQRLEYTLNCPTGGGTNGDGSVAQQLDSGGTGCIWMFSSGTQYIYDGWRVIQERDTNNTPVCAYTRGSDLSGTMEGAGGIGGLLARTRYFAGGPTSSHFYFSDGNGNVTYMIDTNQSMVASYRYDPFGNTISSSGSLADQNVYRFSSKEILTNSGTYYFGYRFYDPSLQRWINQDPLADGYSIAFSEAARTTLLTRILIGWKIEQAEGPNLALFAANNPVSYVDPLGREHVQEPGFTVPYSQWNEKLKDMWPDLNNCLPRPLRMTKGKACRAACWALTATIPFVCPETFPGSFVCAAGIIAAASYCADGCPR